MTYTRVLFDRLPEALRTADEAGGIISHITRSIQPQLDIIADRIETEEYLYDVDLCPPDMLDWLGQLVGLATVDGKYLGLGLNPLWPAKRKREVIARAWVYWQISGTNMGVREGLALWLDWPGARDPTLLEILMPLEDTRGSGFNGWWSWATPYDWNLAKKFSELRKLGNGNDFDRWSLPLAIYTPLIAVAPAPAKAFAGMEPSIGSALGLSRPWLHCYLKLAEWDEVVVNIRELNPEIWAAEVEPLVFVWLDFIEDLVDPLNPSRLRKIPIPAVFSMICEPVEVGFVAGAVTEEAGAIGSFVEADSGSSDSSASVEYLCHEATTLFELRPRLKLAVNSKNWKMFVTTGKGTYTVNPVVMFFVNEDNERSVSFDLTNFNRIYLEFLFTPIAADAVSRVEIYLGQSRVLLWDFAVPAQIRPSVYSGFKAAFQLGDGVELPTVGVSLDLPTVGVQLNLPIASVYYTSTQNEGTLPVGISSYDMGVLVSISEAQGTDLTIGLDIFGSFAYGVDWFLSGENPDNFITLAPPTSIVIPAGLTGESLLITIWADAIVEPDEVLTIALVPSPNIEIDPDYASAVMTFLNDDTLLPTINVEAASPILEGSPNYPVPTVLPFNTHRLIANAHAFTGTSAVFISDNSTVPNSPPEEQLTFANFNLKRPLWYKWTAGVDGPVRLKVRYTDPSANYPTVGAATSIQVFIPSLFFDTDPRPGQLFSAEDNADNLSASLDSFDPLMYFYAQSGTEYYILISTNAVDSIVNPPSGYVGFELESVVQTFFTITRTGDLTNSLQVNYILTPESNRANRNYFVGLTEAVFAAGQSTTTVVGLLHDDALAESNTSLSLTLQPRGNYTLGANAAATLSIVDDDVAFQSLNLSVSPGTTSEGT